VLFHTSFLGCFSFPFWKDPGWATVQPLLHRRRRHVPGPEEEDCPAELRLDAICSAIPEAIPGSLMHQAPVCSSSSNFLSKLPVTCINDIAFAPCSWVK
jgi:hypothetical protein